jgi:hypothetical protein
MLNDIQKSIEQLKIEYDQQIKEHQKLKFL